MLWDKPNTTCWKVGHKGVHRQKNHLHKSDDDQMQWPCSSTWMTKRSVYLTVLVSLALLFYSVGAN